MAEQISAASVLIEEQSSFALGEAAISAAVALVETSQSASFISAAVALAEVSEDKPKISGAFVLVEIGDYVRPTDTVNAPEVDNAHTPVDGIVQNVETVTIYRPSFHAAAGIFVDVWKPAIVNGVYNPEGSYVRSMQNMETSWSHVISVDGGFKSASASLAMTKGESDDWISNGLGRHIVAYNEAQEIIFEGFVNKITYNNGALTHVRGPLMDIVNRLTISYTPIDPETGAKGITTETLLDAGAQSLPSQQKWGIIEAVLNAGECTDADASQYRSMFLAEYSEPAQTNDISMGGTGNGSISLDILGYSAFLEKYIYTNDSIYFDTLSNKLIGILQADPNGLFTDFSGIQTNSIAVPLWEDNRSTTAKTIIEGLVAQGDASDLRTFFGIYANRRAVYVSRPTTVTYHQRLADPAQRILDNGGNAILPWNVKPGKWLYIDDFALTAPRPLDLRKDPRALLIEQVSYSAPWGLSIQGSGAVRNLPQYLAKLGLRGK